MEQAEWRGMPYFDVFGRKRHLTQRELHGVIFSSYTYIFWVLIISVFVVLDLHSFAARVSMAALVVYTVSITMITFMGYYFACEAGLKLSCRYSRFFMIFPLLGFVSATLTTYGVELVMSGVFGDGMSIEHAAEKLPINLALTLMLETLYLTFVLPIADKIYKAKRRGRAPSSKPTCDTLTIAGKTFYCADLVSVSSQDHYVKVKTRGGEELIRARLSDLTAQLDCQNGIQPHRSHWVTRGSVVKMAAQGGGKCLELVDGSHVPVARGRIADVREWLES